MNNRNSTQKDCYFDSNRSFEWWERSNSPRHSPLPAESRAKTDRPHWAKQLIQDIQWTTIDDLWRIYCHGRHRSDSRLRSSRTLGFLFKFDRTSFHMKTLLFSSLTPFLRWHTFFILLSNNSIRFFALLFTPFDVVPSNKERHWQRERMLRQDFVHGLFPSDRRLEDRNCHILVSSRNTRTKWLRFNPHIVAEKL